MVVEEAVKQKLDKSLECVVVVIMTFTLNHGLYVTLVYYGSTSSAWD